MIPKSGDQSSERSCFRRNTRGRIMIAARELASPASGGWRKLAALLLAVAVVGLPVNQLEAYVLLLVAAVVIFSGEVSARAGAWATAVAIVVVAIVGQFLLAPPRIEEGHNVFLPSPAIEHGLPADVYRRLANEFDAQYPPAVRCRLLQALRVEWLHQRPRRGTALRRGRSRVRAATRGATQAGRH
jgi:hypothetical protein